MVAAALAAEVKMQIRATIVSRTSSHEGSQGGFAMVGHSGPRALLLFDRHSTFRVLSAANRITRKQSMLAVSVGLKFSEVLFCTQQ